MDTSMTTKPFGKVKIYAAGGTGMNNAYPYNAVKQTPGFASLSITYADASRSNMRPDIPESSFFMIKKASGEELDGSGAVRRANAKDIAASVKPLLLDHPPEDFNLVIFNGGGGTGSVLGPELVSELLARDMSVVAIVIGSDESETHAGNTVNTLKSLENIATVRKRPVVMHYSQSPRGESRDVGDKQARLSITALAILMSRQFEELDTKDLHHWLDWTKVPTITTSPQLAVLKILTENSEVDEMVSPISIASLFNDTRQSSYSIRSRYSCKGYGNIPYEGRDTLHYAISVDAVADVYAQLSEDTKALKEEHEAHRSRSSLLEANDVVTETGMVL